VELAIQGGLTRKDVEQSTDDLLPGVLLDRDYAGHPLGADRARKTIAKLLGRYRERRLLKRCFVLARPEKPGLQDALVRTVVGDQRKRMAMEAAVARALDLPDPAEVILYCPRKGMQLKEATVPVRRAGKGIRPLTAYRKEFPALDQLVDAYRDLWKLYVFVPLTDPDRLDWAGAVVEKILRRSFPGIRNEYRP
jgi:hypothetical protein